MRSSNIPADSGVWGGTMAKCEENYRRYRSALFFIFLIFLIIGNMNCRRPRFQAYDGTWWVNIPLDQRLGFIDGFVDCYTYGSRKEEKLQKPRNWYQAAVSAYYEKNGDDREMLVGQVLIRVAETSEAPSPVGQDSPKEARPNGVFDGTVWLKYSEKERIGFVEGNLNALMPQTSRLASFPENPQYYADAISKRYETSRVDQGDSVKQRIGEILWVLRNRGQQASK
jgi:hypothetical protein